MANEKKLIIGADVAGVEKSFTKVKKMLEGLQKEGIKVSNVLKDMTIEKNHGMGKFAKAVVLSSQKMKDFRGITEDTAKVMKNVWQRTMQQEQQSLDRTSRQLERLNKLRKEQAHHLSTAKSYGGSGDRYQSNVDRIDSMIAGKVAERMSRQDALRELKPNAQGGTRWDQIRTVTASLQAVAGGAAQILGTLQNAKTMSAQNISGTHDFQRGVLGRMTGGDFSDLYFGNRRGVGSWGGTKGDMRYAMDRAGGTGLSTAQGSLNLFGSGLQAVGGIAQMAPGAGGAMGRMAGGAGGLGGGSIRTNADFGGGANQFSSGVNGMVLAGKGNLSGGPQAMEAATVGGQWDAMKAASPYAQATLGFISSTAGLRVGASKALQGQHMGAWGMGSGFGLDMGESMAAAAQLSRMAGVSATMGGVSERRGRQTNAQAGLTITNRALGLNRGAFGAGAQGDFEAWKDQQDGMKDLSGFKPEYETIRTRGANLLQQTLGLESRGFDRGAAGQMMTQMMFSTGGDQNKSQKQMEAVLSKAFSVGLRDARLGEEIGKATAEASIGMGGRLDNASAYGAMLTGGLGGKSTLFDVQSNIGGAAAFNDRMNNNSYFNAVKMEAARNVLGSGGSHTQMLALQGASLSDLVGNSKLLQTAGISGGARDKIVHSMANAGVSNYLERGDSAMSDLQKGLDENGGDLINALRAAKKRKDGSYDKMVSQYGALMGTRTGTSMETMEGEARTLSGYGDAAGGKGTYANHTDGTAAATVQAQQRVLNKLFEEEINIRKDYLKALKGVEPTMDELKSNDGEKSYAAFQQFMEGFMKLIDDLQTKTGRGGFGLPPQGVPGRGGR
jgi:hypothetical protein